MENLWNEQDAQSFSDNALQMRVYTSRLLGRDPALVMHGGGNTSVKDTVTNLFGEIQDILFVKGSGWDLATIEAEGFAPVKLDILLKLAEIADLSDSVIVREQRAALTNPTAPNPSVEAILHAIIPFKFVDHTHADALVSLTNTPNGEEIINEIYGKRVLVVPYVMPGFILARKVFEMTQAMEWEAIEGIILMNHGIFTFADSARASYDKMIELVSLAEDYLSQRGALSAPTEATLSRKVDLLELSQLRQIVSEYAGKAMLAQLNTRSAAHGFASLPDMPELVQRGLLTPDHVIRIKRIPALIQDSINDNIQQFVDNYSQYFAEHHTEQTMLDPAPRWAVWQNVGLVTFAESVKEINIVNDLTEHTIRAIQWAEHISQWQPLAEQDIFEMEYWELEQAKLNRKRNSLEFQGKIAIVTGAANGIGLACAKALAQKGAVVVGLDINPKVSDVLNTDTLHGLVCDLNDNDAISKAIEYTIQTFGGLDILVSNAGIFPESYRIEAMDASIWDKSMAINLSSHQRVLQACIPYLKHGIDPAVVVVGSKNFPAPGRGASAYSVAKAGVTQLARVAALELAQYGIRVNVVHPDAVFDTGIWSDDVIEKRAANYGLTPEQYMTKNLLKTKITSGDVAEVICTLAGSVFSKTTGAQIPIDGGNERVI